MAGSTKEGIGGLGFEEEKPDVKPKKATRERLEAAGVGLAGALLGSVVTYGALSINHAEEVWRAIPEENDPKLTDVTFAPFSQDSTVIGYSEPGDSWPDLPWMTKEIEFPGNLPVESKEGLYRKDNVVNGQSWIRVPLEVFEDAGVEIRDYNVAAKAQKLREKDQFVWVKLEDLQLDSKKKDN